MISNKTTATNKMITKFLTRKFEKKSREAARTPIAVIAALTRRCWFCG